DGPAGPAGPAPGDVPQIWVHVEVESTITLQTPLLAHRADKTAIAIIRWKVTLKDLAPRPILLSYAASDKGPWRPLDPGAPDRGVKNTGRFEWVLPKDPPERIWIRLHIRRKDGSPGPTLLNGTLRLLPTSPPVEARILGVEK